MPQMPIQILPKEERGYGAVGEAISSAAGMFGEARERKKERALKTSELDISRRKQAIDVFTQFIPTIERMPKEQQAQAIQIANETAATYAGIDPTQFKPISDKLSQFTFTPKPERITVLGNVVEHDPQTDTYKVVYTAPSAEPGAKEKETFETERAKAEVKREYGTFGPKGLGGRIWRGITGEEEPTPTPAVTPTPAPAPTGVRGKTSRGVGYTVER